MKNRLLILSDLWGITDASWVSMYVNRLSDNFKVVLYNSCELAEMPQKYLLEAQRHAFFLNEGIEKAVENLIKLEKEQLTVLAFSIGGTIAWKACLNGLDVKSFYAISSTRLRYETERPKGKIALYYGGKDVYKPSEDWFENIKLTPSIIPQKAHEMYKEEDFVSKLCLQINKSYEIV